MCRIYDNMWRHWPRVVYYGHHHSSDVTWTPLCLKSPLTWLFVQHVVQVYALSEYIACFVKSARSSYLYILWNLLYWLPPPSTLRVTGLCAGNSPGPVNSPHKGPVTRKMFPLDDVIMGNKMRELMSTTPTWKASTVRCRYNAVNFLPNPHEIHPIACPLGRGIVCNLWFDTLIYILLQSTQCRIRFCVILDRVITALDCTLAAHTPVVPFVNMN